MGSRIMSPRADAAAKVEPSQETIRFGYAMATIAVTTAIVIAGMLALQKKPADAGASAKAVLDSPILPEQGGRSGQGSTGQAGGTGSRAGDVVAVSGQGDDLDPWSAFPFLVVPGVWLAYRLGRSPHPPVRRPRRTPSRIGAP